jgi:hypothetical protein
MKAAINEPQLLVSDAQGIYIAQIFCQQYRQCITNADQLKEDIDICLVGPDHEFYWDAWENIIDNAELLDDNKEKMSIGNLGDSGDLWAIPENYEYPEDY